ncbi:unnamed protein product [Ostreobium quekettii]|uniref:HVA22-like protein n=1 Tax=Ostreobium quekettii TaxID=121088 RepID=A0A8S1J4M6_9CHLO|nr:unnamed protein product [Ostreobium quekettii]|eukprot:evm.model.scf_385.6 EVM.evm.TU.scf_385.6   scf_385:45263-45997(-)
MLSTILSAFVAGIPDQFVSTSVNVSNTARSSQTSGCRTQIRGHPWGVDGGWPLAGDSAGARGPPFEEEGRPVPLTRAAWAAAHPSAMVFAFASRVLQNLVAYAWPAYLSYKSVESRQPEGVRDWCIYWFVLALFTIAERVADAFLFWVPLYYPAKVAFVLYLWHPRTLGAKTLYGKAVRPTLGSYELEIDQAVEEARVWVRDCVLVNKNKAVDYLRAKGTELAAKAHALLKRLEAGSNEIDKRD